MFLDWLERRIDPFASFEDGRMPPKTVTGFAAFYLRPMRLALVSLFVVAVAAGTVEASLYLLMGWAAVGWMGAFYRTGGLTVLVLILAGGACYTLGAVVYGRKRPNPWPGWFGFHEIFHTGTIAGFVCHYVAISMITYAR
jgi:channel protein (hemolysin III family)